ncbi:hypothetical protein ACETIH_09570, partial [Microvirga arabica]
MTRIWATGCNSIAQLKVMAAQSASRTLFFFEKPSAMRQMQRFFKSPSTVCVSAEGQLLAAEEPGNVRDEWRSCPVAWCKSASPRLSRVAQAVTADSLRTGSSLNWLRLSSDM